MDVIVVSAPGVATITSTSDTICGTGSVTLTASGLAVGATVQWQRSPSGLIDTWTNVGTNALTYMQPLHLAALTTIVYMLLVELLTHQVSKQS